MASAARHGRGKSCNGFSVRIFLMLRVPPQGVWGLFRVVAYLSRFARSIQYASPIFPAAWDVDPYDSLKKRLYFVGF
jgi:hypothetical protein